MSMLFMSKDLCLQVLESITLGFHFTSLFTLTFTFIRLKKNTLTILHNPQIAKLIEAGCAFKSNVIISKNEKKKSKQLQ